MDLANFRWEAAVKQSYKPIVFVRREAAIEWLSGTTVETTDITRWEAIVIIRGEATAEGLYRTLVIVRWEAAVEGLCEPIVIVRWEAAAEGLQGTVVGTTVIPRWGAIDIVRCEAAVEGL